ncbi:MAG: 3-dehydroquinate synthase family protein [Rubricoccaceae bacterium]|nr:3-dehydroquinate synthase family protein [Rubricoccaceae bacterium]
MTDENVAPRYLGPLARGLERAGWRPAARVVGAGEGSKSIETLGALYDWALGLGIDRQTPLLALGGGVVGDLGGLAAATLLRGLPLVHLPTSVIAQVDSAIGGKTGVNHVAGKNLIGAFHQPRLVLVDVSTLGTLPDREFRSGLAEAVKHALLDGDEAVARLHAILGRVMARDLNAVAETVWRAAGFKAAVVSADEQEDDQRAALNLGHTFAHAIEKAEGYGRFTHGEAVALGLRAALHLSASVGEGRVWDAPALPDRFQRASALVRALDVSSPLRASDEALMVAMETDKKRTPSGLRFVVLDVPGAPRLTADVPAGAVAAAWAYARAR